MALDATIAGAAANSYLTVAEADALAAADLGDFAKAWTDATTETKEAALIRASDEVDLTVGRVAYPATSLQALLFPRAEDVDAAGAWILPIRLRRATYLQAAFLVKNAEIIDRAASRRAQGLVNFSNPDGTSGQVAEDVTFGTLHPRVQRLLDEFSEGAVIGRIIPT